MDTNIREVFKVLRPILSNIAKRSEDEIALESHMYLDLGIDSLGVVELTLALDESYFPGRDLFGDRFVDDICPVSNDGSPLLVHDGSEWKTFRWDIYRLRSKEYGQSFLHSLGFSEAAIDRLDEIKNLSNQYGVEPFSVAFLCACVVELLRGIPATI